jgi:Putative adhesin
MTRPIKQTCWAAILVAAASLGGCRSRSGPSGTFSRTLNVSGPVRLELTAGSGDSRIEAGPSGEVRIHAQFRLRAWPWQSADGRLGEIQSNPPVAQDGNLIRVGAFGSRERNELSVNYTITVPPETEIRGRAGSGDFAVEEIKGPADLQTDSGTIFASAVTGALQVRAGSGDVKLENISGPIEVVTRSGDVEIHLASGEVRVRTGSADVHIEHPGGSVEVTTGSGDIGVAGATRDLRLQTGSGDIAVEGDPGATNYWDLRASSGDIDLRVPAAASFRLYARTRSGDIDTAIPFITEGSPGRHDFEGRIADGKARVEIETSSGDISLR